MEEKEIYCVPVFDVVDVRFEDVVCTSDNDTMHPGSAGQSLLDD